MSDKNKSPEQSAIKARFATLEKIIAEVVPLFLDPVPHPVTLRRRFKNVPQMKSNPLARHGGGPVYYSVPHIERVLRGA